MLDSGQLSIANTCICPAIGTNIIPSIRAKTCPGMIVRCMLGHFIVVISVWAYIIVSLGHKAHMIPISITFKIGCDDAPSLDICRKRSVWCGSIADSHVSAKSIGHSPWPWMSMCNRFRGNPKFAYATNRNTRCHIQLDQRRHSLRFEKWSLCNLHLKNSNMLACWAR